MNWMHLEVLIGGVSKYSTVIGRIWLIVVFVFCFLVFMVAVQQIIFITCPSLVVVAHAKYREMKDRKYTAQEGTHLYAKPGKKRGGLWYTYIPSVEFKAGFDAIFLCILYLIDHFDMPRVVKCPEEPCPNTVNCYRQLQKKKIKIFTLFMVVTYTVCIFLCICEILYLITKKILKCLCKQQNRYRRVSPRVSLSQNHSNMHNLHV